ncbi:hypothetical protein D6817_05645 [Candidatus Pacearchaeota archaeon]|nr:MAG: hypothetical protein D6817_05645 [Candidatus Pacearchaeota archaeon]
MKKKYLSEIGLNNNEAKVIEALILHKELTSSQLQEETELTKSTLFRVLSELKRKGIIAHDFKQRHNTYRLSQPQALVRLVSRKRREFRRMELELEELLHNIQSEHAKQSATVEVYYGTEQAIALTERSLLAKNKLIYDFGNLDALWELIGKSFDENIYIKERMERKIFLKMLTYDTPAAHHLKKNDKTQLREVKIMTHITPIDAYWKVYDDTVTIYSNIKEKFVINVRSETLAQLFRHMFEVMWESAQ